MCSASVTVPHEREEPYDFLGRLIHVGDTVVVPGAGRGLRLMTVEGFEWPAEPGQDGIAHVTILGRYHRPIASGAKRPSRLEPKPSGEAARIRHLASVARVQAPLTTLF